MDYEEKPLEKPVKKEKKVEIETVTIEKIEPVIPDNCFVAKGFFNTTKGKVKPGDIVNLDDLIGSFVDLERTGLA